MPGKRMISSNLTLDPFIPSQGKGVVPVYQRADNREEPGGRNKRREEQFGGEGRGRRREDAKAAALLPRNGINTQRKQMERVWRRLRAPKRKRRAARAL